MGRFKHRTENYNWVLHDSAARIQAAMRRLIAIWRLKARMVARALLPSAPNWQPSRTTVHWQTGARIPLSLFYRFGRGAARWDWWHRHPTLRAHWNYGLGAYPNYPFFHPTSGEV